MEDTFFQYMDIETGIDDYIQRYNRIKSQIGKKNIKLLRDKKILKNDNLSDNEVKNIILSLSNSLDISKANIFRYLSYRIYELSDKKNSLKLILNEIFSSGVIVISLTQLIIPLCIIISEFEYLSKANEHNEITYKFSSFLLSVIFMYLIHNELTNEYRDSYLLLHTRNINKETVLIGMISNLICSLLSIICIPIVINSSDSIIDMVFNSTAIIFLCELDDSLLPEKYEKGYVTFISKYKINQLHTYEKYRYTFYYVLYNINYFLYWFTDYFCQISFVCLPFLTLFLY